MNLAIFDLDHTLINCDSDNEWPKYLMQKGVVDEAFVRTKNDKFYQDYLNGWIWYTAHKPMRVRKSSRNTSCAGGTVALSSKLPWPLWRKWLNKANNLICSSALRCSI